MVRPIKNGKTGRPIKVPGEIPTSRRIFDASVDLFAKKGYDKTSIRDIARTAGITESAVYRHYPSKEAILDTIFDRIVVQVYSPLPTSGGSINDSKRSIYRVMLEGLPQFLVSNPELLKIIHILFNEMKQNEKIRNYMRNEFVQRSAEFTEDILKKEMDAGRIRKCDVKALSEVFNAFRFSWLFQNFILDYDIEHDLEKMNDEMNSTIRLFEDLTMP